MMCVKNAVEHLILSIVIRSQKFGPKCKYHAKACILVMHKG